MTGTTGRMIGVTSSRLLRHYWYPVVRSSDLHGSPLGLRLLGRDLVVWRGPGGDVVAAPDRCTHRMAELSAGVVTDGVLSCPSHGWLFGTGGQCLRAGMTGGIPDDAHLRTVQSAERYGLVWVCLEEPVATIPGLGPEDGAQPGVTLSVDRWKALATRVTERAIEASGATVDDVELPFACRVQLDGARHAALVVTPFDDFHSGVTMLAWSDGGTTDALGEACHDVVSRVRAALDAAGASAPELEHGPAAAWRARLEAAVVGV